MLCVWLWWVFFVFTLLLQHQFNPSTISQFADAQLEFYHFFVILGLSLDLRKKRKLEDKQICENAKIKLDHVSCDSIISILQFHPPTQCFINSLLLLISFLLQHTVINELVDI